MGFKKALSVKFFVVLIIGLIPGLLYVNIVVADIDLSYHDLEKINGTCPPRDSCFHQRNDDSPDFTYDYSCSCDALCSKLGTCCIDSRHRSVSSPSVMPSCRKVEGSRRAVFMVDRCPGGDEHNSALKHLCEEEWNGDDNVMALAPVTSSVSSKTYKNYFCFRCHESTENFVFWDLQLLNSKEIVDEVLEFRVRYHSYRKQWMATAVNGSISLPVYLKFFKPFGNKIPVYDCKLKVISSCSDSWDDEDVRRKCDAYTAIIYIAKGYKHIGYKNPHCALCNYESLKDMICQTYDPLSHFPRPFSFSYLIDGNRSDGDRVEKVKKCEGNTIWDPYSKICRKTSCAIPSYVIRGDKCSPP